MTPPVRKMIGGLAMALVVGICVAPFYYLGPGGDGVLDQLVLDDGTEFIMAQRYNDDVGEPYSVDFYVRLPGSSWGWCYIEHQDIRWTRGRLRYNPQNRSIEVFRGFRRRAAYFLDRRTFVLYSGGEFEREWGAPTFNHRNPPPKEANQAMQLTATRFAIYALRDFRYSGCVQIALAVAVDSLLCSSPFELRPCHGLAVRSILVSR